MTLQLQLYTSLHDFTFSQARRKRCGMAAVAAPKICMEREKKKEEKRGKKEKKGGRKELGGEESKSERCTIRLMGVKMKMRKQESDEKTLVLFV